jgi:hypothetical protein
LLLASSAIHRRFVDRFAGLMSLPVFLVDGSLHAAPPFPPAGPGEPGSPPSAVLRRRYDFPHAHRRSLICFAPAAHGSLLRSCSPQRSRKRGEFFRARALDQTAAPIGRPAHTWTRMGSLRSSGDPSRAFAPFQDPGRTDVSSPLTATPVLPPLCGQRRLRHWLISGLTRSFGTHCHTLHA